MQNKPKLKLSLLILVVYMIPFESLLFANQRKQLEPPYLPNAKYTLISNKTLGDAINKPIPYYNDSIKKPAKSNFFSKMRYAVGAGITASSHKKNYQANLQVDFINKEDVHLGIIVGYSNVTLVWPKSNRTIAMINLQYDLLNAKKKNNIYFNIGAGVGYFSDAYTFSFMGEAPYDYFTFSPVGHVGFGYIRTISKNWGIFTEIGFGGPYFLNAGVFF